MRTICTLDWEDSDLVDQIAAIHSSRTQNAFFDDFYGNERVYYIKDGQCVLSFIALRPDEDGIFLTGSTRTGHENQGLFSEIYRHIDQHRMQILAEFDAFDGNAGIPLDIKTTDDRDKIQHLADKFGWHLNHSNMFYSKELHRHKSMRGEARARPRIRYAFLCTNASFPKTYTVYCKKRKIAEFSLGELGELGTSTVFFHAFYVLKKHRGLGHATRIMQELFERLRHKYRSIYLHVFSDNLPAIHLYEALGFSLVKKYDYYEAIW